MVSHRKVWMTQPQIIRKAQMILVGISVLGDSRTDVPGLWARFGEIEPRIVNAVPTARYVVITWGEETLLTYQHFLYVGVEVKRVQRPPLRSVIKVLPALQYAVFSAWSHELDDTWFYALQEWLPASPYREPGFIIQRYDRARYIEARRGRREIDILIPLRKAEEE